MFLDDFPNLPGSLIVIIYLQLFKKTKTAITHLTCEMAVAFYYIFSGALTPIRRSAFAMVVRTAVMRARRARVMSSLDGSNTFSAL